MSENLGKKEEIQGEVKNEGAVSPSETVQNQPLRRSKRKVLKKSDSYTKMSPRSSASPPRSSESRGRRKNNHRSFRSQKRNKRRSRSSSYSEDHMEPTSRSPSPKAKELSHGLKGGLVALGGLLAAGLPIAGELYLKHKAHEHEREKHKHERERDQRKEIRHGQAMEEKERKRMDLELEALEEETGWTGRKHEIDIRRREVDLQIKEMELDGLLVERRPNCGKLILESRRDPASRADVVSSGRPRRIWIAAEDTQAPSYRGPSETPALLGNMPRPRDTSRDLVLADFQQRRRHNDTYFNSGALPPNIPPEQHFRTPAPFPSPASRSRHRSPTRLRAFPATTALLAGSLTAYRVRDDDGPWLGKKAVRIATSAGAAALTSLTLKRDETPPGPEDGLVAQVVDSRPFAVAAPVIAGMGAERIFWGSKR